MTDSCVEEDVLVVEEEGSDISFLIDSGDFL
jgi:hypothetical protein